MMIAKNWPREIKIYPLQMNTFLQTEFHTKSICKKILKDPGQLLSMINLRGASIAEKFLYLRPHDIFILSKKNVSIVFQT